MLPAAPRYVGRIRCVDGRTNLCSLHVILFILPFDYTRGKFNSTHSHRHHAPRQQRRDIMLVKPKLEGYVEEFSAQGFCVIPNALEPTELAAMRTAFDKDRLCECMHVHIDVERTVVLLDCW